MPTIALTPKALEVKHLFVPLSNWFHLTVLLASNAVIDVKEIRDGHKAIKSFSLRVVHISRQENTSVAGPLNKGVDRVTICLHGSNDHSAIIILESCGFTYTSGTPLDCFGINCCGIVDRESHIFDTITVLSVVSRELSVVRFKR